MKFEREEVITLRDENGNEIIPSDKVMYNTKTSDVTILATFLGLEAGLFTFRPLVDGAVYKVKPSTVKNMFRVTGVEF